MRQHLVSFHFPGSFVDETESAPIESWDTALALSLAHTVVQKSSYGYEPYCFRFMTNIIHEPIPDGEGGLLEVRPKKVAESCRYFIGGTLFTVDALQSRGDPSFRILISNMEANDAPRCYL